AGAARAFPRTDRDPHGARGRDRPDRRARAGRRRLRDQAVQPARAGRAGAGRPPPRVGELGGSRRPRPRRRRRDRPLPNAGERWGQGPPHWWPAGGRWPPDPGAWAGVRRHFMRRVVAFVALAVLLFGATLSLLVTLAWHAAHRGPAFAALVVVVIGGLVLLR